MSNDLRTALLASLEDDIIHGSDGSHEEGAPSSADAIVQPDDVEIVIGDEVSPKQLIEAAVQGEEVAGSLDEVADKAEEVADNGDATEVSAEMLTMNIQHVLKPLRMNLPMSSLESNGDIAQYHRNLAKRCRTIAERSRNLSAKLRARAPQY